MRNIPKVFSILLKTRKIKESKTYQRVMRINKQVRPVLLQKKLAKSDTGPNKFGV